MHQDILLNTEIDILVLLMVACLAAISLRKINFPYYGEINYYWSNGEDSPDLAIAFPTKISARGALVTQNQTVE